MLKWLKSKVTRRRRIDPSSDIKWDGFVATTDAMPSPDDLHATGLLAAPTTTDRSVVEAVAPMPLIGSRSDRRRKSSDW
jgi:hypothetical protein